MIRSASGTYSLPSACMKSYWVSTSQKMTRAMAGNLSGDVGKCQQDGGRAKTRRKEKPSQPLHTVHHCASVRLVVAVPTTEGLLLPRRNSFPWDSACSPPTP